MNCLYKPALLDNFISNGVNAQRSAEQALLLQKGLYRGFRNRSYNVGVRESDPYKNETRQCLVSTFSSKEYLFAPFVKKNGAGVGSYPLTYCCRIIGYER